MGVHHGNEGICKVGSDTVAELQSWNYTEEDVALLPKTSCGDTEETYKASGCKRGSGDVQVLWDETDTTGQGAMTVGSSITLNLYPEGAEAGDTYRGGTVVIESVTEGLTKDGFTTYGVNFKGVLTQTTV